MYQDKLHVHMPVCMRPCCRRRRRNLCHNIHWFQCSHEEHVLIFVLQLCACIPRAGLALVPGSALGLASAWVLALAWVLGLGLVLVQVAWALGLALVEAVGQALVLVLESHTATLESSHSGSGRTHSGCRFGRDSFRSTCPCMGKGTQDLAGAMVVREQAALALEVA